MIIALIILATIISTLLGGLFAMKYQDKSHLISGFGAGAILGVALFDLLPESLELTKNIYSIQTLTMVIAIGFCIFMIIDRSFSLHAHQDENCKNASHKNKFGALAIVLHSILDGFGIGIAFKVSMALGFAVAIAVLVHGFADGINTVNMVMRGKNNKKTLQKWLIVETIAPASGFILAYLLVISKPILGLVLALFLGLFLYISASDLIPESHHKHPVVWTTVSTIFGILTIYVAMYFSV